MRKSNGSLLHLLQVPAARRDAVWRAALHEAVKEPLFVRGSPSVFRGPDRFPYLALFLPPPGAPGERISIPGLAEWATEEGVGIAINPHAQGADWVFTYGDLFTLRHFGAFEVPQAADTAAGREVLPQGERLIIGAPSESFLPGYVRRVLRRFFREQLGIEEPGVFLIQPVGGATPPRLVFSIFPEDVPGDTVALAEQAFHGMLKGVSWFLPRHYDLIAISRDSELVEHFHPL